MKRICLVVVLVMFFAFPGLVHAQFGNESPIPYFRYSVTAGLAGAKLYGDVDNGKIGPAVYLRGNYFLTHGVSIGLELQEGLLWGEDDAPINGVLRQTSNLFHAGIIGVSFQPIKFLQDDHRRRIEYRESFGKRALNSIYAGAGVGALYSLQWEQRRGNGPEHTGSNYGASYLVSTNLGIEIPLHSLKPNLLDSYVWNLVINGQLNFSLDDELDGYSGVYPANESRDSYSMLSIGANLRF